MRSDLKMRRGKECAQAAHASMAWLTNRFRAIDAAALEKAFTSDDIRFTTKGETLYAIALAWPNNGKLAIKSLARDGSLTTGQTFSFNVTGLGQGTKYYFRAQVKSQSK